MDLVNFLTGDEAIKEWQRRYPNSEDATPPNDYTIVNDNPRKRTMTGSPRGGRLSVSPPRTFAAFDWPGFGKVALGYLVTSCGSGSILTVETRVALTGDERPTRPAIVERVPLRSCLRRGARHRPRPRSGPGQPLPAGFHHSQLGFTTARGRDVVFLAVRAYPCAGPAQVQV